MKRWKQHITRMAVLATLVQTPASAQTLFYNGEWNFGNSQTSATNTRQVDQVIFENFVVGPTGWNVTGVFGEFLTDLATPAWTTANWEIRSGITTGNSGTLKASGVGSTTNVATGRDQGNYTEYRATVNGLNVFLSPGIYWLAVAPVGSGNSPDFDIYLSSTDGDNGVNKLLDGDTFWRSQYLNYAEPEYAENPNFAVGVLGTLATSSPPPATTVPEPSTFALLLAGGTLCTLAARRRARADATATNASA